MTPMVYEHAFHTTFNSRTVHTLLVLADELFGDLDGITKLWWKFVTGIGWLFMGWKNNCSTD